MAYSNIVYHRSLERFEIQTRHLSPIHKWIAAVPSPKAINHSDIDLEGVLMLLRLYPFRRLKIKKLRDKPYLSWEDVLWIITHTSVNVSLTLKDFCAHPRTPISYLTRKGIFHPGVYKNPSLDIPYLQKFADKPLNSEYLHRNPGLTFDTWLYLKDKIAPNMDVLEHVKASIDDVVKLFPQDPHDYIEMMAPNPSLTREDYPKFIKILGKDYSPHFLYPSPHVQLEDLDKDYVYSEYNLVDFSISLPLRYLRDNYTFSFGEYAQTGFPFRKRFAEVASKTNYLENQDLLPSAPIHYRSPYVEPVDKDYLSFWISNRYLAWERYVPLSKRYPRAVKLEVYTLLLIVQRFNRCSSLYFPPELVNMIIDFIILRTPSSQETLDTILSLLEEQKYFQ